eukprot:s5470_g7.t1
MDCRPEGGGPELSRSEAARRAALTQILQKALNCQALTSSSSGRSSLQRNPDGENLLLDESNILHLPVDGSDCKAPTPLIPLLFADVTHAPVRTSLDNLRDSIARHRVLGASRYGGDRSPNEHQGMSLLDPRKKVAFCRSDPASHVVLIAPRCGAELTQDPEGCQQVWLLCIGKCSEAELNGLLFNLSRRGRCRGVGGQGAVFTGTSRTKVADFQDSRILRELRGQLTLPGSL